MLSVVPGCEEEVAAWLDASGHKFSPPFVALAVLDGSELVGGVVFNNYTGANIEMSTYAVRPLRMTRGALRAIFSYPFDQAGCARLTARTRAADKETRKKIRRLGFKPEGRLTRYYGDDDAMIYGMTREDCRWING